MYQRYDRDLQASPAVWNGIAARIAVQNHEAGAKPKSSLGGWFAGLLAIPRFGFAMPAVALVAIALVIGVAYWRTRPQAPKPDVIANNGTPPPPARVGLEQPPAAPSVTPTVGNKQPDQLIAARTKRPEIKTKDLKHRGDNQSDVLFTDAAYTDIEDRDTATHLQQAQDLLVSIRNIKFSDDDEEVDVSYEKAESRRLLNENVVLRRDAEAAGRPAPSLRGAGRE